MPTGCGGSLSSEAFLSPATPLPNISRGKLRYQSWPRDVITPVCPWSAPGRPLGVFSQCDMSKTPHLGGAQEASWSDAQTAWLLLLWRTSSFTLSDHDLSLKLGVANLWRKRLLRSMISFFQSLPGACGHKWGQEFRSTSQHCFQAELSVHIPADAAPIHLSVLRFTRTKCIHLFIFSDGETSSEFFYVGANFGLKDFQTDGKCSIPPQQRGKK